MFQTNLYVKSKLTCQVADIFFEYRAVYEIMWKKYCRTGQATGDNMAHAHCMQGTQGYKYTHTQVA